MKNKESGFTLVEMLIALSLFTILASFSILLLKPQQTALTENNFITQLQADLYYGQTYALANQQLVQVKIFPAIKRYYLHEEIGTGYLVNRYYDPSVEFLNQSSISFYILPNGNFSRFRSYDFSIANQKYRITTLIGKGRFYVTEL
ncbi:competence type IV pilus minor pilin ComGD [Bacillus sp. B1-b2]|uniref:competence type IV pilus minor pilin ComGD n=1 Tax=Bacillus sp. B1-b2 TaxID=2653201 RepID=UPI0012627E7E|nr:competence type IV pilus minor pilin ComGD [Bacillus sp. B1-b2]KAB7670018.1 type II secretion system protein [Bacillus sp. B1-b2]